MVTDEEIVTGVVEEAPEPAPIPEPEPAPVFVPEPAPEPEAAPEPEEPAAPVEVVTVDDLLDRLTGTDQDETAEPSREEESSEAPEETLEEPAAAEPVEVAGMDAVLKYLEGIRQTEEHPALTTPFEAYTVTEGLLLLLFLSVFVMACLRMLKGGFKWLR